jgi:hypothetical protein
MTKEYDAKPFSRVLADDVDMYAQNGEFCNGSINKTYQLLIRLAIIRIPILFRKCAVLNQDHYIKHILNY